MLLFFCIFVVFLCVLNFFTSNVLVWWSVFLLMTVVFVCLSKGSGSYVGILNYFVIQESLGLFFLVFNVFLLQFFIVMMKVGVAPFHFWVFSVTGSLYDWLLMWFLTFQKLPFLPVLVQLFDFKVFFIFLFGICVCYFQLFVLKGYKSMMVISSTESFNWVVLTCFLSVVNVIYLFFYYVVLMVFLMPNFNVKDFNFVNWEVLLVFLNVPFSVSFFIKIFVLSEVFKLDGLFLLFLLLMMFLSMLCFSLWLVNMSVKNMKMLGDNFKVLFFLVFPMMVFSVI
uniref:NADH dehydrogenase subunit 2 n=3 Tax=Ascaris TaxID=6251 RepID=A0A1P8P0Y5_ASCSU|nr:NADH dehydrogenase subunit 2 [Ascaris suum]APX55572.1 NADH dehydrogenase subunit 2 [Ascaris suum]APX55584.1 NADH dehydrogenase subunit 2 [Ascaris lumbricoides]WAS08384.1 NADH dehydrogenase subunit 2 [Ascaris lumbricoides]